MKFEGSIKSVSTKDGKVFELKITGPMTKQVWDFLGDVAGMLADIDILNAQPDPSAKPSDDDDNLDLFDDDGNPIVAAADPEIPAEHSGMCKHNFEIGKCQLCAEEFEAAEAAADAVLDTEEVRS